MAANFSTNMAPEATNMDAISSRKQSLTITNFLLFGITAVVVILRAYARLIRSRSAGLDDLVIGLAFIMTIAHVVAIQVLIIQDGGFQHIYQLSPNTLTKAFRGLYYSQIFFYWVTSLTKISMLLFYRRVCHNLRLQVVMERIGMLLNVVIAMTVLFIVGFTITALVQCHPMSYFWNRFQPGASGHCVDLPNYTLVTSVISLILDVVLLLISIGLVLCFRLPIIEKLLMLFLLGAGVLTCIAGAFRVYYLDIDVDHSKDITWHAYPVYLTTIIERDVGALCASLPACKVLFKSWIDRNVDRPPQQFHLPDKNTSSSLEENELGS